MPLIYLMDYGNCCVLHNGNLARSFGRLSQFSAKENDSFLRRIDFCCCLFFFLIFMWWGWPCKCPDWKGKREYENFIKLVCLFCLLIWLTSCLKKTFTIHIDSQSVCSSFIVFGGFIYNNAAILQFQVMFQHSVRHSPLRIDGLLESVSLPVDQESKACDIEMDGWQGIHYGLHQFFILSAMLRFFTLNFWFTRMLISVKASIIYIGDSED